MNHAPRNDAPAVDPSGIKPILANYANSYLLELWLDSPMKNRIFIGSHNLDCSGNTWTKRYTDEQLDRYDFTFTRPPQCLSCRGHFYFRIIPCQYKVHINITRMEVVTSQIRKTW